MATVHKLGFCSNQEGGASVWMQMAFDKVDDAEKFQDDLIKLCLEYVRAGKAVESENLWPVMPNISAEELEDMDREAEKRASD